jgi:hypothetical protein
MDERTEHIITVRIKGRKLVVAKSLLLGEQSHTDRTVWLLARIWHQAAN